MNEMTLRFFDLNLRPGFLRLTSSTVSGYPSLVMLVGILAIATGVWAFWDARRRGRSGLLAAVLVVATWPFSLAWWPWLRPGVLSEYQSELPAVRS